MNHATPEATAAAPQDWKAWRRQRRRKCSAAIDHWLETGFGPVAGNAD